MWRAGAAAQMYDLVAGGQGLTISRYMSPTESRRQFPTLAEHGPGDNELKGTVRTPLLLLSSHHRLLYHGLGENTELEGAVGPLPASALHGLGCYGCRPW